MSRGSLVLLVLEPVGYLGEVDIHLLSLFFFFFPLAQERKGAPPLLCCSFPFLLHLGFGFFYGSLRPGTANRWERRPSPPLALWAVDLIRFCFSGVGFWFGLPLLLLRMNFLVLVAGLFLAQGAVQVQAIWSLAQSKSPAVCSGARQGGKQHQAK